MRREWSMEAWRQVLLPREIEALEEHHVWYDEILTADEVLEIIVDYNGGIATAYQARSLINRIYGLNL